MDRSLPVDVRIDIGTGVLVELFGLAVRQLREQRRWSQERLAEASDLNRSYVGEVERGAAIASLVTAHKLALALGVDLPSLLQHCGRIERQRALQRIRLTAIAC
jgi:transcriptional regulator with XRE-family HTH domain